MSGEIRSWRSTSRRPIRAMNEPANCSRNSPNCIRRTRELLCGARYRTMGKRKSRAAYMISAVAEQYEIHPQTLRLYEREGLLKPSRSEGNTRLYTDEDLERLEVILH